MKHGGNLIEFAFAHKEKLCSPFQKRAPDLAAPYDAYDESDDKSENGAWDSRLRVSSRGYMLGYHNLKDPSVSSFFRFLARVGDGMMKMQIIKIEFGGKQ